MRLIDADALKEFYGKWSNKHTEFLKAEVDGYIDAQPTIDAEPVRHGRWEWYEDWGPSTWLEPPDLDKAGWKCSNCGIDLGDYLTDCLGVNVYVDEEDKMPKIKICPHCGAKMDAKEDAHGKADTES